MKKAIALFTLMILTSACTVGPNYKRPKVDAPGMYRGATPQDAAQPLQGSSAQGSNPAGDLTRQDSKPADKALQQAQPPVEPSFGDQKWWEVFQDPQLQQLIRTALQNNYDVRIAATRILEAQAQLGITRADQLPTVGAGASAVNQRYPKGKEPYCPRSLKPAESRPPPPWHGNSTSGASTVGRRKQRVRICWQQSGRTGQSPVCW